MFYRIKNYQLPFLVTIFISLSAADKENKVTVYNVFKEGIIGGIAGGVEPLLTQPLINIKIHRQQGKHLPDFITTVKARPSTLYTGLGANMVCSVPSIAAQIAFDAAIGDTISCKDTFSLAARSAVIGTFSALTCNSTELIIINQQNNRLSALKNIKKLYQANGSPVFARGFLSKATREAIFCMGFLGWYPNTKSAIEKQLNTLNTGFLSRLNDLSSTVIASCLVGGPTALMSHPFDTASTLLQTDPSKKDFHGYMDIIKMVQQQGIGTLYRGCSSRAFLIMLAIPILTSTKDSMKNIF